MSLTAGQGVIGFPELIYAPKCKICRLVGVQRGLLKLIHRKHRDEGLGEYALYTSLEAVFASYNIPRPSIRSFGRHLASHVNWDELQDTGGEFDLPDPVEARLERLAQDADSLLNSNYHNLPLGQNDSDYHNMVNLFQKLLRRIESLDADPTAFQNEDGSHGFQKLNTWSGMIANAKSILEGLSRMRNSDRMTVSILEQHTKRYAMAISGPIGLILREIRDELQGVRSDKAQALATRLTLVLDHDILQLMTDAAMRSLRESKEQYKLLN